MKDINKLSDLCKLSEADEKTEKEFAQILSFLTVKGGKEAKGQREVPKENTARLRSDIAEMSFDKSEVLTLAPRQEKGYIAIPRALEEV